MSNLAATIEQLSNRWMKAWLDRDRATLEALLAPDFESVLSAVPGRSIGRDAWLEMALGSYRCTMFRYRDVHVRDLGRGLAVMSAISGQVAQLDGLDRSSAFFITDLWRRSRTGEWQVCARYSSHPEAAGTSAAAMATHAHDW